MAKKASRFQRIREHTQWLLDEQTPAPVAGASRWSRYLHFWVLVWRSFARNRCFVRASALAYGTVLALVPMLAVAMSISSALLKKEGEEQIDRFIIKLVASVTPPEKAGLDIPDFEDEWFLEVGGSIPPPAPVTPVAPVALTNAPALVGDGGATNVSLAPISAEAEQTAKARRAIAHKIHQFIQNTRSGTLGVTGTILLVFVAISMLNRIEDAFNDIWGVAHGRSWFMRIVLYWGVISLAPVLVMVALGLATGPHWGITQKLLAFMPFLGPIIFQLLPLAVLCLTFAAFYALMPNTQVHWKAALAGGLAGGILFHLNNLVSVLYVSRVVSNSKIYGSLGLVPVFMIGVYLAWLILLFGAQVAYAYQNRTSYFEERQVENINQRGREFVALRLMTYIGQRFALGQMPPSAVEIAETLAVPTRLVHKLMNTLRAARLVTETTGEEPGYLPARPLETITCHDLLMALRASQGQELATRDEPTRTEVYGEFQRIEEAERHAAGSVTMLALVNRAQGHRALTE